FDNVQVVAAGHPFSSGAYDYTANDGKTSDDAHVTIAGQNGATVTGTDANEILIASDRHVQVDATVHSGDTKSANANDAFSFHFTGDANDVSITQIKIDVSGIGHFDQGNGGRDFELGSNSDVTPTSWTSGDTDVLTIDFAPGAFTAGETLRFGIDTDGTGGHDLDNGGDFGDEHVPFTVTLSDGTILSGVYQSDGNASEATFTSDLGSSLFGEGGDDYLVSSAAADNLTGGTGADHFFYNAPSDGNDAIHDFSHAEGDTIDVLLSNFTGLSAKGPIADADFVVDNNADTVNLGGAHFAYNDTTGQLYYDGDGGDAGQRLLLATIENHGAANLQAGDIHAV
ncbi:MAG TPA: hypothetical protein VFS63_08895, partial [Pseudolabrys sp.]|nr:hypothetical protein [Pseudolabrys sp.]